MTYIVKTPNPDFEGIRAGLLFRRGQATTDDQAAADYCRDVLGYKVEQDETLLNPTPQPARKRRDA